MNQWQPIKSAPKDKKILLYDENQDEYGIAKWDEEDERWYVYNHYEEQLYMFDATHWMPLEAPQ